MSVDLIVPLKPPTLGKSRLRQALGSLPDDHHAELVLALAQDTLHAAMAVNEVRRVLVTGREPAALGTLRDLGAEIVDDGAAGDLNSAIRAGERLLRGADPMTRVAVLQPDLPALRTDELAQALSAADDDRMYVSDRHGTGTTLLTAGGAHPLNPCFGPGSARAHARTGARACASPVPSVRGDVDTSGDLEYACSLGLGIHTHALLESLGHPGLPPRMSSQPGEFRPVQ